MITGNDLQKSKGVCEKHGEFDNTKGLLCPTCDTHQTAEAKGSDEFTGCMPDADSCEFLDAGWCKAGSHVCEDALVLENGDVACERGLQHLAYNADNKGTAPDLGNWPATVARSRLIILL